MKKPAPQKVYLDPAICMAVHLSTLEYGRGIGKYTSFKQDPEDPHNGVVPNCFMGHLRSTGGYDRDNPIPLFLGRGIVAVNDSSLAGEKGLVDINQWIAAVEKHYDVQIVFDPAEATINVAGRKS